MVQLVGGGKRGTTAVATPKKQPSAELVLYDYGTDEGAGFENLTKDDLQIPFLALLQDGSPQTKKGNSKHVEGAEQGMFFNTVTEQVFDPATQELVFVPAARDKCYVEWKPRSQGGGLIGRHGVDSSIVADAKDRSTKFGNLTTKEENDLTETHYVFGVLCVDGDEQGAQPLVLSFTSTKIKVLRKFNTLSSAPVVTGGRSTKPPLYAHRVKLESVDQVNKAGIQSKNVKMDFLGGTRLASLIGPDAILYKAGKSLYEMVISGKAKADESTEVEAQAPTDEETF